MPTIRSQFGVLLTAVGLLASSLALASPAAADDGGTLVLDVVDQYGKPLPEAIIFASAGAGINSDPVTVHGRLTVPNVTPGKYNFASLSPWGGFACAEDTDCLGTGGDSPDIFPSVTTVYAGQTTHYTLTVTVPSIKGRSPVGESLRVQLPSGFSTMESLLTPRNGVAPDLTPTVQWMRGDAAIPGATATSFTISKADRGHEVYAALSASTSMTSLMAPYQVEASPFRTNTRAIALPVVATTTKSKMPRKATVGERVSVWVKVRAAASGPVTGAVLVSTGNWTGRRQLVKGAARVTLPRLRAGRHKISVSFRGTQRFGPSKAPTKTIVVKR